MMRKTFLVFIYIMMNEFVDKGSYSQTCFQSFRWKSNSNRFQGYCGYSIGGIKPGQGILVKSMTSCCRRQAASGWGLPYVCRSCHQIRGWKTSWSQWSTSSSNEQTRARICSTNVCAGMKRKVEIEKRSCSLTSCHAGVTEVAPSINYFSNWSTCIGLPELNMSAVPKQCCAILKMDNFERVLPSLFENCFSMQFISSYNLNLDSDFEFTVNLRGQVGKCFCRDRRKLFSTICCARSYCHQWKKEIFRNLCRACRPLCPACYYSRLSG